MSIPFNPAILLLLLQESPLDKVHKDVNAKLLIMLSLKILKYLETVCTSIIK